MKDKIYTRKGDLGQTELFDGKVVCKNDSRIEFLGKLDYFNTLLGHACVADDSDVYYLELDGSFSDCLRYLQKEIFEISGYIAMNTEFDKSVFDVNYMETSIDNIYKNIKQEFLRG